MVNGPDDVYVERKGRIERVGQRRHGNRRRTRRRDGLLELTATALVPLGKGPAGAVEVGAAREFLLSSQRPPATAEPVPAGCG